MKVSFPVVTTSTCDINGGKNALLSLSHVEYQYGSIPEQEALRRTHRFNFYHGYFNRQSLVLFAIMTAIVIVLLLRALLWNDAVHSAPLNLWPQPQSAQTGEATVYLAHGFKFSQAGGSAVSPMLQRGFGKYEDLIGARSQPTGDHSYISECQVHVKEVPENEMQTLSTKVDNSYTITISSTACSIDAKTIWGGLAALETFTQLLVRDEVGGSVSCPHVPVSISDFSRYDYRGLLIDTGRHYLSVGEIKRMIDTMPMAKLNVLHWHIVDAQSFPLMLDSLPEMAAGAYSPKRVYTSADLADITSFAADRGVNVVFEIDVPGHTASWRAGKPEVMANCPKVGAQDVNEFALNPTLSETYTLLDHMLRGVQSASRVGMQYLHLGGDEVDYDCWAEDASIDQYMKDHNIGTYADLLSQFVLKADSIAQAAGATVCVFSWH